MGTNRPASSLRSSSRPSLSSDPALWAPTQYTHQLACMEHELEHFLSEVRNRQGTLGAKAGKEREPPNLKKWGSDQLRTTVFEMADNDLKFWNVDMEEHKWQYLKSGPPSSAASLPHSSLSLSLHGFSPRLSDVFLQAGDAGTR
ncbi:hypothetical protein E2320_013753 [Naja naja]|nr:hypothetical protein E2320_013753 [Naja naja]